VLTHDATSGRRTVTRYLISFEEGSMTIPEEDLPDVARAAHDVVRAAQAAGVWIHGGGVDYQETSRVDTDGTVSGGAFGEGKERLGGFSIVDVPSRDEALVWAARFAVACRCAQDVRELMPDPEV
jgi:hypothetical protein